MKPIMSFLRSITRGYKKYMSASEAFVEVLEAQKVKNVFGIVGSAFMDALDLFPTAGVRFISVQHEQNAAHMADGYARVSGKHGVCIAQNGPGVTNFVTGIASAYGAHSPVVMITPEAGIQTLGHGGFQETDQMAIFSKITKQQFHLNHPDRMAEMMTSSFQSAKVNRGPVQFNIPRDYFYHNTDYFIPQPKNVDNCVGNPAALMDAASLLSNAKTPIILAGGGVGMSGATQHVVAMAEKYKIPMVTSYLHNDVIPGKHALMCGSLGYQGSQAGMKLLKEADVVLAVGTRLGPFGTLPQYGMEYWPNEAKIIQIDIDPNQLGKSKSVDLKIHGDVALSLEQINKYLWNENTPITHKALMKTREEKINQYKREWETELNHMTYSEKNKKNEQNRMKPRKMLRELEHAISPNSIITTDIGNICSVANSYVNFSQPQSFLPAMTFGSCGYSVPAAMGAKIAAPDRVVFSYTGEGAFGMSIPEIMTCMREKIPITMIVFNNSQWGAEKRNQEIWFGERFVGTNLENPSYAEIAQSMGAEGIRVSKCGDIKNAISTATMNQLAGKPTVIEMMVSQELDSPFRRDAMKIPKRYLDKYRHTDIEKENWD